MREITAVGGIAKRVRGVGHDASSTIAVAARIAEAARQHHWYPMLTGFRFAPEAMAGVKTIAYELGEQVPDAARVYAPVGGGGLLTGLHRGYADLGGVGPALIGVHPHGSDALSRNLAGVEVPQGARVDTRISGLQMAVLYDSEGAVDAVRGSGGSAVGVSDDAIFRAQAVLADAGLLVEPAGATALAGLIADLDEGRVRGDEDIVILATGAAYKDAAALDRLAGGEVELIEPEDVADALVSIAEVAP
jgi:threonine synthase